MIKVENKAIIQLFLVFVGIISCIVVLKKTILEYDTFTIGNSLFCAYLLFAIFILVGATYGKSFFLSSHCWFISFFTIYQTAYPIILYYGKISYFGVKVSAVRYTSIYALKFISMLLLYFFFLVLTNPRYLDGLEIVQVEEQKGDGLAIIAFFNFCVELFSFIQGGNLAFILSGSHSRIDINNYLSTVNLWGYVGYINVYIFVMFVTQYKFYKRKSGFFLVLLDLIFYIYVTIATGSRKFVLWIFIVCVIFYLAHIFTSKVPVALGMIIVFIASYQRIVIFDGGLRGNLFKKIAGIAGEFIFTTITFPIYYQRGLGTAKFHYPTYLDSILYFVPRAVFPEKNYSIAKVFMDYMDVGMGFASNPMLEAYVNCGDFGWIVEAILIGFILNLLMKYQKRNFYLFIFGMIFLVDLNRGDVAYFFRQIFEVAITVNAANYISKRIKVK